MTNLVPAATIESIVGESRHASLHLGRAVAAERAVYILHSEKCRSSVPDLRDCDYSKALDCGIRVEDWLKSWDRPVVLAIRESGTLIPRSAATQAN